MEEQGKALLQTKPISLPILYDNYGGMLLGYISQVVKDKGVAEEYLLKTFNTIAKQFKYTNWDENNNWLQLLSFARAELTPFHETLKKCGGRAFAGTGNITIDTYLDEMTDEQKDVFCSIYYNKKTIAGQKR